MGESVGGVWVIEASWRGPSRLAVMLMGNYAIRAFASVESLERLGRCSRGHGPSVIMADLESIACLPAKFVGVCRTLGLDAAIVFVGRSSEREQDDWGSDVVVRFVEQSVEPMPEALATLAMPP